MSREKAMLWGLAIVCYTVVAVVEKRRPPVVKFVTDVEWGDTEDELLITYSNGSTEATLVRQKPKPADKPAEEKPSDEPVIDAPSYEEAT